MASVTHLNGFKTHMLALRDKFGVAVISYYRFNQQSDPKQIIKRIDLLIQLALLQIGLSDDVLDEDTARLLFEGTEWAVDLPSVIESYKENGIACPLTGYTRSDFVFTPSTMGTRTKADIAYLRDNRLREVDLFLHCSKTLGDVLMTMALERRDKTAALLPVYSEMFLMVQSFVKCGGGNAIVEIEAFFKTDLYLALKGVCEKCGVTI